MHEKGTFLSFITNVGIHNIRDTVSTTNLGLVSDLRLLLLHTVWKQLVKKNRSAFNLQQHFPLGKRCFGFSNHGTPCPLLVTSCNCMWTRECPQPIKQHNMYYCRGGNWQDFINWFCLSVWVFINTFIHFSLFRTYSSGFQYQHSRCIQIHIQ